MKDILKNERKESDRLTDRESEKEKKELIGEIWCDT